MNSSASLTTSIYSWSTMSSLNVSLHTHNSRPWSMLFSNVSQRASSLKCHAQPHNKALQVCILYTHSWNRHSPCFNASMDSLIFQSQSFLSALSLNFFMKDAKSSSFSATSFASTQSAIQKSCNWDRTDSTFFFSNIALTLKYSLHDLSHQWRISGVIFPCINTGGEGLWKQVFTCWEHFRLWQKVLPMFWPDTFHSHFKCNLNMCLQCNHQTQTKYIPNVSPNFP